MTEENKNLSQVADTAIDKALLDVQNAFATQNWEYTYEMLRKAVYISADVKIMDECEIFMQQVNRELNRIKTQSSYTAADRYTQNTLSAIDFLKEMDFQFLKKLMILLKPYLRYSFGPKTRETGIAKLEHAFGETSNE
jgi:hypothetical protein